MKIMDIEREEAQSRVSDTLMKTKSDNKNEGK